MKQLLLQSGPNSRWGLAIVGPDDVELPAKGSIEFLGKITGLDVYKFNPSPEGEWIVPLENAEPLSGARTILRAGVKRRQYFTLIAAGDECVIVERNKRGRVISIDIFREGKRTYTSPAVLLGLGLVEPER